ncbi:hypothetical protein L484_008709 [Morus notabilis]|uniref:Uncharacterized protein n=1 Tax=Morus notabilis TaxID=981085 RepID=W9R8U0_9ROSA|nr:hypothetical protein L484_008709 [Morus notabilis]
MKSVLSFAELNAKDLKLHAKDAELHAKDAELHAKDAELQAGNAELSRKDKQIQTLKEDAANAVKKIKESNEYENLMEQWFQVGYNASHSQGSSLHAYEYWPPLGPSLAVNRNKHLKLRELETIKNQLADAEKPLNVREGEIHAEDKELRTEEEKIEAVEEAAADAINISQSQTNMSA